MSLSDWGLFMITPFGIPFTAYCIVQIYAIYRLQRGWRLLAALLPIPLMGYIVYVANDDYARNSNLWPLALFFVSPVMIIFLWKLSSSPRKRIDAPKA